MTIRCPLCGFLLRSDKISSLHLVTEDKEVTRNQLKVMMMVMMMVMVMAMAYTQNTYGTNTYKYSFRR